jgi:hypothetical protein
MPATTPDPPVWDVFLSYGRSDASAVATIAEALGARGLRVFQDETGVPPFAPISATVMEGLRRSKLLLAFYSADYPLRTVCQQELTFAFLAGQREGDPRGRVLVVNPESSAEHVLPIELRDTRHMPAPRDKDDLRTLATAVAERAAGFGSAMGEIATAAAPPWLGVPPVAMAAHANRLRELWVLHSLLHADVGQLNAARARRVAVVHGATSGERSSLIVTYAEWFAAAFPGGVVWLSARDPDPVGALQRQLDGTGEAAGTAAREGALLWVIDDVPPDLAPEALRPFLGPHRVARTVISTSGARHLELGAVLQLEQPPEAVAVDEAERRAAWNLQVELAHRVGVAALPPGEGSLREALSSLYELFRFTKEVLRQAGPPTRADVGRRSSSEVGETLLEVHLRPLLTKWHPELMAHEHRRPEYVDPVEHERAWKDADTLRAELRRLRTPLLGLLTDLSEITGSSHGTG